jgi:alpha-amylase
MKRLLLGLMLVISILVVGCGNPVGTIQPGQESFLSDSGVDRSASGRIVDNDYWWKRGSIYQLYVKSFKDSDGDGIGDLQGVIDNFDYLTDLGVTTIWLMPVFKAAHYHGYDTEDYYTVRSEYGDNQDLYNLIQLAHANDMKVILDLVINHTSYTHPWFTDPDKTDWYAWANPALNYNNDNTWDNIWDWGAAWGGSGDVSHTDPYMGRGEYYGVFDPWMPDLNWRNPEVRAEIKNIMRYWVEDYGVDGFRADAVRYVSESKTWEGVFQRDTLETHAFWKEIRSYLDSVDPEAILLAEAPTDTYDEMLGYYGDGDEFHNAFHFKMQYSLMSMFNNGWRPADLLSGHLYPIQGRLPANAQDVVFLSNHDSFAGNRVASQLGGDQGKMRLAASVYLLLSGNPAIYYGEELGMQGAGSDPALRLPIDWNNAAAQDADSGSLLNHYRRLVNLRHAYDALEAGISYFLSSDGGSGFDGYTSGSSRYALLREFWGESILVVHNLSSYAQSISVNLNDAGNAVADGSAAYVLMGEGEGTQAAGVTAANRSSYSVGTVPARGTKVIFLGDISLYRDSQGAFPTYSGNGGTITHWDNAWFRGTPNGWGTTAMDFNEESGLWETVQTFGDDNPRFKISRFQDWSEAYPAQDYPITEGPGDYFISFDDQSTTVVEVTKIDVPTWSVSGRVTVDGAGLEGVSVTAGGRTALTDGAGYYNIGSLPEGNYSVSASKSGYTVAPATRPVTVQAADVAGIDFTAEANGSSLVVHYAEHEYAGYYILHAWDGLTGNFTMSYEGFFNDRHWWSVTIEDAPASFKFCFNNSNDNWDGVNRIYDSQAAELYVLPFQSAVYDYRP